MIPSKRRDRKTKAMAEILAMIADAHPEFAPGRPHIALETAEELLWGDATEFSAALESFCASHTHSRMPSPRGRSVTQ
jgi:hypothetical protein